MIFDFARIDGPRSSKQGNFEALVSQLLILEFDAQPLDGSGGDGGIDCFLATPSGRLTVFQIKYLLPRIGSAQRGQIKRSFHRVLERTKLSRWVLCIPINPTEGELEWFLGLQARGISLEWWGRDKLEALLSRHYSLCRSFFPLSSLEAEFESFRRSIEAAIPALRPPTPSLGRMPTLGTEAALEEYLNRAQKIGQSLSYDYGIITSAEGPRVAIDTSDIHAFLSSGTGFGQAESLIDFNIRTSPFQFEIPPPFMGEVVSLLRAIAADAQGLPDLVLTTDGGLDLLDRFVRAYEAGPRSEETYRVYRQIQKVGSLEGAMRTVSGIPKLQSAISSGRIAVSPDDEWKDVDRTEFHEILREFQGNRHGRPVHNYVDALVLSLIKKKFEASPDSIRVVSSAHSFKRTAEKVLGKAHPVRTARDFAYLLSAKAAGIEGARLRGAAERLGKVAAHLVDLDSLQLSALAGSERSALLESFDEFLPVYHHLLWPIDELIIAESRSRELRSHLWEMAEFYQVLVGESEIVVGFRLWWERAYARLELLRSGLPVDIENEVAELVSSLTPNPGDRANG